METSTELNESLSESAGTQITLRITQLEEDIENGILIHRQKTVGADGRRVTAACWNVFHQICEAVEPHETVANYYFCIACNKVIFNPNKGGNTNKFNRHECTKKQTHPIIQEEKDRLKYSMAKFVVDDIRPYSLVEGKGFKSFCYDMIRFGQDHPQASTEALQSALPSRNTVKDGVAEIAKSAREVIAAEMKNALDNGSVSAVIDAWTDNHQHQSYLGIIAILGYEREDGLMITKKYTLSVNNMTELRKTKDIIRSHLFEVLALYGVSKEVAVLKIVFVHDRGGNIRYGLFDEAMIQIFCFCHILNNILGKMLELSDVKKIIKDASELTSYVKNAGLCAHLKKTLKTYSKTRWNSVCMMLESIVENYPKIVDVLTEKNQQLMKAPRFARERVKMPLEYIASINITQITEVASFLAPFKLMSEDLEGFKKPTLHKVWPAYLKISELLKPDTFAYEFSTHAHIIEDMKLAGLMYINSNLTDIEPKERHKIATILHPLLKSLPKLSETEKDNAYRIVDRLVKLANPNDVIPTQATKRQRKFKQDYLNDFCQISGLFKLT